METKKFTNNVLAYSSGVALSVVLAGATKAAIDGMFKNATVQMATSVLALVIVVSGTMTFSKIVKSSLEKVEAPTVAEPKAE